jgi:hypothetical protein
MIVHGVRARVRRSAIDALQPYTLNLTVHIVIVIVIVWDFKQVTSGRPA